MKNREDLIIVIPIYNQEPKDYEKFSLSTLNGIKENICFIHPESLDPKIYSDIILKDCDSVINEAFDDKYFESTIAYSDLMTSDEFYKRFIQYKYILIFQTDCILFNIEKIYEWIDKDFDYIGSPIVSNSTHWPAIPCCGNGGLSLRKVQKFIEITSDRKLIDQLKQNPIYKQFEDVLFCIGVTQYKRIDKPAWDEAALFAWDMNPDILYNRFKKLPEIGCHAYGRNLPFWKNHVAIPIDVYESLYSKHKDFIERYYFQE